MIISLYSNSKDHNKSQNSSLKINFTLLKIKFTFISQIIDSIRIYDAILQKLTKVFTKILSKFSIESVIEKTSNFYRLVTTFYLLILLFTTDCYLLKQIFIISRNIKFCSVVRLHSPTINDRNIITFNIIFKSFFN